MHITLVLAALLAPGLASAQPATPSSTHPPVTGRLQSVATEPSSSRRGLGFSSMPYLFNRSQWSALPGDGRRLLSGEVSLGLAEPLEVIVLFNAWHLPSVEADRDIRLTDIRRCLFQPSVHFTSRWPEYSVPGFVLLARRRDASWLLIARLSQHYLVEDSSGIGLVAAP